MSSAFDIEVKTNKFGAMSDALLTELNRALTKTAFQLEAVVKKEIQTGEKTGEYYPRPGGKEHQASAPGEAPATDTGNLVNSIFVEPSINLQADVVVTAEYAAVLEFGGGYIEPRPFLEPGMEAIEGKFKRNLEAAWKKATG